LPGLRLGSMPVVGPSRVLPGLSFARPTERRAVGLQRSILRQPGFPLTHPQSASASDQCRDPKGKKAPQLDRGFKVLRLETDAFVSAIWRTSAGRGKLEDNLMSRTKEACQRKRRTNAVPTLGAAGLSLSLASGPAAAIGGVNPHLPQRFHTQASLVPNSSDHNHPSGKSGAKGIRGQSRNIQFVR
jgi:hypothetical protein